MPPFEGQRRAAGHGRAAQNRESIDLVLKGDYDEELLPSSLPSLREFCAALLVHQVDDRLGCSGGGLAAVKAHPFFDGLDWRALAAGALPPPIVPADDAIGEAADAAEAAAEAAAIAAAKAAAAATARDDGAARSPAPSPPGMWASVETEARFAGWPFVDGVVAEEIARCRREQGRAEGAPPEAAPSAAGGASGGSGTSLCSLA